MPLKDNYCYRIRNSLYLNLTNRCSNNCDFCIQHYTDGLAGSRLVLSREPGLEDVIGSIQSHLSQVSEVVFCGFGEPTYRLALIIETCQWLCRNFAGKIRLNTNGLGNLIQGKRIIEPLSGLIDRINISLNATGPEEYEEICHPSFGEDSYPSILEFIKQAKAEISRVTISAVTASGVDMDRMEEIAEELGVGFVVR